jgi:hypothetical protein
VTLDEIDRRVHEAAGRTYTDPTTAASDLSGACVAYGRELAGLSPLPTSHEPAG